MMLWEFYMSEALTGLGRAELLPELVRNHQLPALHGHLESAVRNTLFARMNVDAQEEHG